MIRKVVSGLALTALLAAPTLRADGPKSEIKTESIKIGTLAPAESPWGQVFKVWQMAVRERTKLPDGQKTAEGKSNSLELTFFYNAQQGDEGAMVTKMKSGQLDGAAITAVGLAQIHRPILALQLPGVVTSWAKLDRARKALKGDFEKGLQDAGFTLVGWGDIGLAHTMTKGFAVTSPGDLKGKKPYVWREDPIAPILYQVVGGVTPVPLGVPEVLPNLNTGAVDLVTAPSLAAEQLQWASRLDNINANAVATAIGALVFSNKKIDALPADQKAILAETGKIAAEALTDRIRKEDAAAFERLKGKMKVSTPNEAQMKEWAEVMKQVRTRLTQGTFKPELVQKIEELANQ